MEEISLPDHLVIVINSSSLYSPLAAMTGSEFLGGLGPLNPSFHQFSWDSMMLVQRCVGGIVLAVCMVAGIVVAGVSSGQFFGCALCMACFLKIAKIAVFSDCNGLWSVVCNYFPWCSL